MTEEIELQRTPEWYAARCGKVTASRIVDVIARTQKGWGAARAKYMEQIIAERLTGKPQDMRNVRSLTARAEMEPEARAAYSFYSDNDVDLVGFIQHPTIEQAGASPDGLVGADGMIEIKCLDPATHIRLFSPNGTADAVILDYLPQMHFGMDCAEREWCDFESYAPLMRDEELRVYIRRIQRDEAVIKKLRNAVEDFLAEVDAQIAPLLALTGGQS